MRKFLVVMMLSPVIALLITLTVHVHGVLPSRRALAVGEWPNSSAAGGDATASLLSKSIHLLSQGRYEDIEGVEVVWQLPPAAVPRRGVLFVAHGCSHGAIDWWPRSDTCPQCIGLPEEMNITLHSILRGYAVVAVSSVARKAHRCWQYNFGGGSSDHDYGDSSTSDLDRVKLALDTILPREGLQTLPLYALGASSGGAFVLGLPIRLPGTFAGLAVQIAGGPPGLVERYKLRGARKVGRSRRGKRAATDRIIHQGLAPWPPTIFIHMPRDAYLAPLVEVNVASMKAEAVRTAEIRVQPAPLTPLYLAQRCAPEVDEATSRAIYQALRSADYIDEQGFLRYNPRDRRPGADAGAAAGPATAANAVEGGWRAILQRAGVPGVREGKLRLQADASPISEELNLLFAGHELTSETTTDMLDFFEGGAGGGTRGAANPVASAA